MLHNYLGTYQLHLGSLQEPHSACMSVGDVEWEAERTLINVINCASGMESIFLL
jgi:hypothetical protein